MPPSNPSLTTNTKLIPGASPDEVLIGDRFYNVAEFKKRHPGGSILQFYLGQDATEAFQAFHSRSKKVEKFLKSVPSRPKGSELCSYQELDPLVADFEKLRANLEKEGYFKPSPGHIFYRVAELVIMHIIGANLIWAGWTWAGILILGIAQGRCGWFMHEGGHYSLTGNTVVDRNLQEIFYGVGCGMSASFWRNQHNKHHAMPQKLKHDVDLQTLPLVAFNSEIAKYGNPLWLSLQSFLFVPITCLLVALGWQTYLHPRHSLRSKNYIEVFYYLLRYLVAFGYILSDFSIKQRLSLYVAYVWVGGAYIFTNFALSHTHKPVLKATEALDWVRFASNHTINIAPSWWCDWWMGYLNYQIEHHLFPAMPQFRHREISPRVKALFEKHGLQYEVLSYWDAMKVTFKNLHVVGQTPSAQKKQKGQ